MTPQAFIAEMLALDTHEDKINARRREIQLAAKKYQGQMFDLHGDIYMITRGVLPRLEYVTTLAKGETL